MIPSDYYVKPISSLTAKDYIHRNHYSHGSHNAPSPCYGLFNSEMLIGAIMFATPCSEAVRASVFGKGHEDEVIELHRLHILDITPKNTESWFISRALKLLKQDRPITKAVISFSDLTENHKGTIYKASGFKYMGVTTEATFYTDQDGRLRHPRQNGVNIKQEEANAKGWTVTPRLGKNRYIYYFKQKRERIKVNVEQEKYTQQCIFELDNQEIEAR